MNGKIYKIINLINEKIYVGQTIHSLKLRWNAHRNCARRYKNDDARNGFYLYLAINKYGIENFKMELIEENIQSIEELNIAEIRWIELLNTANNKIGYNRTIGGDGSTGRKQSAEWKINKRDMMLGNKNPNFGNKWSDSFKEERRIESNKRWNSLSKIERQRLCSNPKFGKDNGNYGKKHPNRIWIHHSDLKISKIINKENQCEYLKLGYKLGRLK